MNYIVSLFDMHCISLSLNDVRTRMYEEYWQKFRWKLLDFGPRSQVADCSVTIILEL